MMVTPNVPPPMPIRLEKKPIRPAINTALRLTRSDSETMARNAGSRPTINDTVYENDQYVINETRQDVPVGMIYYVTVE